MDQKDLEIVQSGDVEQSGIVFKRFVEKVFETIELTNTKTLILSE